MEFGSILNEKNPLNRLENLKKSSIPSNLNSLQNLGKGKIDSLQNSVEEIDFLIKQREILSKSLDDECEKIKTNIENFLLINTTEDSDGFKERAGLRKKQIEISEMQLNEKVNCWRDVSQLKRELRERQRELSEKRERLNTIDKILN